MFTPGPYRYLRITWDDTHSGRVELPGAVAARRVPEPLPSAPPLRVPMLFERRPSEPGVSRFRVRLPAANLPIVQLDLAAGGGHLLREARVSEARLDGDQATYHSIGSATLRRVVRGGISADALRIPVTPPREALLELVVDDGDNPPLELKAVTAVFAELPWIYVEHEPGTVIARYGDSKLQAPQYDLEAARQSVTEAQTSQARLGDVREVAPVRALSGLRPEPGTASNRSFQYSRHIPPGSCLALCRSCGGAGTAERFVLDSRMSVCSTIVRSPICGVPERAIAMTCGRDARSPASLAAIAQGRSYVVRLPYQRLPGARLVLHTRARVFRRGVTFGMLLPPSERHREWQLNVLSSTMWQHANDEAPARGLVVDLPETRRGDIVFTVDEGEVTPSQKIRRRAVERKYADRLDAMYDKD